MLVLVERDKSRGREEMRRPQQKFESEMMD